MSKNRFLLITTVFLNCGLNSLILFPADKVLAEPPPASYADFLNLDVDYQQCAIEARQAAGIILSEVDEDYTPDDGIIGFLARTSESRASVMCIQDGQNSIFSVVSNGDGYNETLNGEAKSIGDRFIQILSEDN